MNRTPGGFSERLLASLVDFFIIFIPAAVLVYWKTGEFSYELVPNTIWQAVDVSYLTLLPLLWSGYTIGKYLMKIQIRTREGQPVTWKHMLLREVVGKALLIYVTFGLSTLVSVFMILFREDKRAIHDFIGGTMVSYDERFKGGRTL
ncbi:RDD family protein [Sporosarcina trichiuri]|uniref:RDD family protein n=1 Tax=Sporosarcina trichiuri TaxID=3056445 RepID=UPI0025B41750|nr:RDD family protein [Sporosarcina sp. 0.2-SM1T-5]WJY27328.1 RDD family protein [Sporosarcina sp. 0.2-SM1T-5]